ncbi:MAG: prolyl oligopeptidase family serine peptidase [Gammaproteobacteria bacterium]|nr:prolyl oligopeptidase family serine peptidase [Gammaproteobacteria bacterium]MDH5303352.1 prolyl oligopeptidase family serine peptidase [Gammaproteobacteria bacterium]
MRTRLDRASAVFNVDRISVPTLLVHGEYDSEVAFDQFTDFRAKASRSKSGATTRNRDFQFVELEMGTHDIDSNNNRQRAYESVDRFLKRHLN